jgi:hypothetical protein
MADGGAARRYGRKQVYLFVPLFYSVPVFFFVLFAVAADIPALGVGAVPFLWLAYRSFRVGVYASTEGVEVRNVFRSHRVPWDRIARFDWGTWGSYAIGGAYLNDGTFIRAIALNPPWEVTRGQNPAVPNALRGLNEELQRARGTDWELPAGGMPSQPADQPSAG